MEFLEGTLHILFLCFVKILLEYRRDEYSKKSKSKKVEGVGNELLSHIVLWMSFVQADAEADEEEEGEGAVEKQANETENNVEK